LYELLLLLSMCDVSQQSVCEVAALGLNLSFVSFSIPQIN